MKIFLRFLIELLLVAGAFYATNLFIEEVMVPDYTEGWQTREEWEASGSEGYYFGSTEAAREGIRHKRNAARLMFFMLTSFAVGGYFCYKKAATQQKLRDQAQKEPAAANRKIVLYRFIATLLILVCVLVWPMVMLMHGIENIDPETGKIGMTYPFGKFNSANLIILFAGILPLLLGMGPYLILRGIRKVSLWTCLGMTVTLFACANVIRMFDLPNWLYLLILVVLAVVPDFRKQIEETWKEIELLMK